jgi:hypothetical protein
MRPYKIPLSFTLKLIVLFFWGVTASGCEKSPSNEPADPDEIERAVNQAEEQAERAKQERR